MKLYKVVLSIDKQETYFVKANSEEEAEEMALQQILLPIVFRTETTVESEEVDERA
jgi:hypothetical protein